MLNVAYYNAEMLSDTKLSGISAAIVLWPDGAEFVNITDCLCCHILIIENGNKEKDKYTLIQFSFYLTCVMAMQKRAASSDGGQCSMSQKDFIL